MAIRLNWPGATATQVSEQVLDKIERQLQEVPYSDKIRSYAKPGEGTIIFQLREYAPPKDIPNAWYQVRKKIGDIQATLPAGVQGPFFNDEFGDTYGTIYALTGDGFSAEELRQYADFVRQQLLARFRCGQGRAVRRAGRKGLHRVLAPQIRPDGLVGAADRRSAQRAQRGRGLGRHRDADRQSASACDRAVFARRRHRTSGIALGQRHRGAPGRFRDRAPRYVDPPVQTMRFDGRNVVGVGISMVRGGDIIRPRPGAARRPRRACNKICRSGCNWCRCKTNQGGVEFGERIRAHPDRGGLHRAGGEFPVARAASARQRARLLHRRVAGGSWLR